MKLSEIRAKYPEYDDIPTEQLVIGLHRKFYSDMPFRDFHKNIEYDVLPKEAAKPDLSKPSPEYAKWHKEKFGFEPGAGFDKTVAYPIGGKVTDLTGSPEAGFAANVATQAIPALFGYRVSPAPTSMLADVPVVGSKAMMQRAIKPATEDLISKDAEKAISTLLERDIQPSIGNMQKLAMRTKDLGNQADSLIQQSPATANIGDIGQKYLAQYDKGIAQGNLQPVQDVWKNFATHQGVGTNTGDITVQMANLLKKGLYENIGSKEFGKAGTLETQAQKALAHYLSQAERAGVPGAAPLMDEQSKLLNVIDVAKNRLATSGNRDLGGLATLRLDDPRVMAAALADRSPYLKALAARLIHQAGRPEVALPAAQAASRAPEIFSQE